MRVKIMAVTIHGAPARDGARIHGPQSVFVEVCSDCVQLRETVYLNVSQAQATDPQRGFAWSAGRRCGYGEELPRRRRDM